jgi:hypothetical protein
MWSVPIPWLTQGERLTDHYFNNVIGNPLETTVAASHLSSTA